MSSKKGSNEVAADTASRFNKGAAPSAQEVVVGEAGVVPVEETPPREDMTGGNVDQIRDILFGSQMRDYERRFQRLEESLKKDLQDLRGELKTQLETLEQHHRNEFKDVREAQSRETKDRVEALRELSESVKETADLTYQRIKELEADVDRRAAELRDQILTQSKVLAEDIQARDERITTELTQTARMLDDRKLDRSALAQLLVEVAMRISDAPGDDIA